jgi:hypothetical protein
METKTPSASPAPITWKIVRDEDGEASHLASSGARIVRTDFDRYGHVVRYHLTRPDGRHAGSFDLLRRAKAAAEGL